MVLDAVDVAASVWGESVRGGAGANVLSGGVRGEAIEIAQQLGDYAKRANGGGYVPLCSARAYRWPVEGARRLTR